MRHPWHSSLRFRLLVNLLPLAVMLLVIGAVASSLFSRLAGRMDATVKENYQSIIACQAINSTLIAWENLPTTDTNAQADIAAQLKEELALLAKPTSPPGGRELLRQLTSDLHALKGGSSAVVLQVSQLKGELEKIQALNYEAILAANHEIQDNARHAGQWLVLGVAVVLGLSAFFVYRISHSILRPIICLTGAFQELGDGQLRELVPVMSDDELGSMAVAFNKMARLLQEYRRSTTAEIVRLHRITEATLESIPDPVFVLNREAEIELRNPAATTLSSSLQIARQLPDSLQALARSVLQGGHDYLPHDFSAGVAFHCGDAERFFLPRALVMRDREGAFFGVTVVLHDVTRFRLMDSAKTNLVATVSHELKSPLTSVRMCLHLLLEKNLGGLTPKQEELLQAARDDSERLLRILNDLLDLARLEEGAAELRREKIAPIELLQSAREQSTERAAVRRIIINCAAEPRLPVVFVDRQRMDHVLTNLISNAVKYSPEDGEVSLRAAQAADGGVQFSVTDRGPGIPEQFQARVFDRFFRVPGQEKNGAGLGLSIAREITVAHGGRIGLSSAPGKGSTFFVVLPSAGQERV